MRKRKGFFFAHLAHLWNFYHDLKMKIIYYLLQFLFSNICGDTVGQIFCTKTMNFPILSFRKLAETRLDHEKPTPSIQSFSFEEFQSNGPIKFNFLLNKFLFWPKSTIISLHHAHPRNFLIILLIVWKSIICQ